MPTAVSCVRVMGGDRSLITFPSTAAITAIQCVHAIYVNLLHISCVLLRIRATEQQPVGSAQRHTRARSGRRCKHLQQAQAYAQLNWQLRTYNHRTYMGRNCHQRHSPRPQDQLWSPCQLCNILPLASPKQPVISTVEVHILTKDAKSNSRDSQPRPHSLEHKHCFQYADTVVHCVHVANIADTTHSMPRGARRRHLT
jgi:hypothetical protein